MGIFEFVTKGNKKQSGTKTQTAKRQTKPNMSKGEEENRNLRALRYLPLSRSISLFFR